MRIITPNDISPDLRHSNYFEPVAGAVWGPRVIPDLELIFVAEGCFAYKTEDQRDVLTVRAGDVLLILPQKKHTFWRVDNKSKALIGCIHCEMLPGLNWASGDYRLDPSPMIITQIRKCDYDAVNMLFEECKNVFTGYSRYRNAQTASLIKTIWLKLAEHWSGQGGGIKLSSRMERMIDFVRSRLKDPISRLDVARQFDLTPQHVNALFKKELGLSPTQFIHRERVLLAYHYLQSESLSVAQAGRKVGFEDQFYFSKVFKKVMGFSPKAC